MSDHGLGSLSVGCLLQAARLGAVVQTKQLAREKHKRKKKVEGQQRRRAKDAADKEMLRRKSNPNTRTVDELSEAEFSFTFSPRSADLLAPQKDYHESVAEGTMRPSSVGMFLHETKWPVGVTYRQMSHYRRLRDLEKGLEGSETAAIAAVRHALHHTHLIEGKGLRDVQLGVVRNIKEYLEEKEEAAAMPIDVEEEENNEEQLSVDAASALAFLSTMAPACPAEVAAMKVENVEESADGQSILVLERNTPAGDLSVPLQHGFLMVGVANGGNVLILLSVNSSDNPSVLLYSINEPKPGDNLSSRRQMVLLEDFLASLEPEDPSQVCSSLRLSEPSASASAGESGTQTASADSLLVKRKRDDEDDANLPAAKKRRTAEETEEGKMEGEGVEAAAGATAAETLDEVEEDREKSHAPVYDLFFEGDGSSIVSVNVGAVTVEVSGSDEASALGDEEASSLGALTRLLPNAKTGYSLSGGALGLLRNLTSLNLTRSNLVQLPEEVAQLGKLKYLFLAHNSLTVLAQPTDKAGPVLPPGLVHLDVSHNQLTRLVVRGVPELRYLKAANNEISELNAEFGMMMATLEVLNLQQNQLEIFPVTLCSCASLSSLYLSDNLIEFLPPELGIAMPNLEFLDVSRNRLISTAGLETAAKLRIVRAGQNRISVLPNWNEMFLGLAELTTLDLNQNQIAELPPIDTHYQLECISLRKNPIPFVPMRYFQLPMLRRLDLRGVRLGHLPAEVGSLHSLTTLLLRDTGITNLPPQMSRLSMLTELDLGYNHMGHLPDVVCELVALRSLELLYNSIVELPTALGQLKSLMYLDVSRNRLEKLPDSVTKLQELRQLDLSCNKMAEIARYTAKLPKLHYCNFTYNKLAREEKNALRKRFVV